MIDPARVGETLNLLLTTKPEYREYFNANTIESVPIIKELIVDVYKNYLDIDIDINSKSVVNNNLQAGDIVLLNNKFYLVTNVPSITWPRANSEDIKSFLSSGINKSFNIIRPDLSSISSESLEALDEIAIEYIKSDDKLSELFKEESQKISNQPLIEGFGDGVLQIGDLIFLVDPTQIAFNTQNGYQYFPTIRTQGNPKIPTMQQVKNVSITLIFPNEDAINYQLLNLYAMYKRTPFVNIRNKDICSFFKEICYGNSWPNQWLSVGLESIQIQSVEKFPNTLQANITILPFDNKIISNGFKALLSIKDVKFQQSLLYRNRELESLIQKSESKMNEQDNVPSRYLDVIAKDINSSPDFRESIPFRAFYQSLINGREFILDNYGSPENIVSETEVKTSAHFPIAQFRPIHKENMLNLYTAEANQRSISFSYKYIDKDFRDITKQLSNERTEFQAKTIQELKRIKNNLLTKEDLSNEIITSFLTSEDFYSQLSSRMAEKKNALHTLMTSHGITMETPTYKPVTDIFSLMFRGMSEWIGIEDFSSLNDTFLRLKEKKFSKDDKDFLSLKQSLIYTSTTLKNGELQGVLTFDAAIDEIYNSLDSQDKKDNFAAFLQEVRLNVLSDLGMGAVQTKIIVDPNSDDGFRVIRLPITTSTFVIDNKKDIITGWSLIFSNKFVPLNLQAFKYPYYQHLGSDDPTISLNIISTSEKSEIDLKSQLSLLSERLYETIKIVTMNSPELITYLDCCLTVDAGLNNIFNVFGIRKVVFDNSSTVNITGQPGSWNTTLSLSQANLSIDKYHSVESASSFNEVKTLIGKILLGINIDGDRITVNKVEVSSGSGTAQDPAVWEEAPFDFLVRYRYITSDAVLELKSYIEKTLKISNEKAVERSKLKDWFLNGLSQAGSIESSVSIPNIKTESDGSLTGQKLADETIGEKEKMDDLVGKTLHISIDEVATNTLQELCTSYPEFHNTLKFIVKKIDSVFLRETEILKSLIQPNISFFQELLGGLGSTGTVFTIIVAMALLSGSIPIAVGGAVALGIATIATVGETKFKRGAINGFSNFFSTLLNEFNNSAILDLANRIYKDPIIKNKLLNGKIIGEDKVNKINKLVSETRVNCYNDFDVPYISETLSLSPDFYMYNNIMDDYEIYTYFTEATQRYAKIGKLTAMMSTVESEEILSKYDLVISGLADIDPAIQGSTEKVLLKDFGDTIPQAIESLRNYQVVLARANDVSDMVATNLNKTEEDFLRWTKDNPRPSETTHPADAKAWDKLKQSSIDRYKKFQTGRPMGDMDASKLNLIKSARMKTMFEIFEIYTNINRYMSQKLLTSGESRKKNDRDFKYLQMSKGVSEEASAQILFDSVSYILKNAELITTESLLDPNISKASTPEDKALLKTIKEKCAGMQGLPPANIEQNYVSLPDIRNLETLVFNKIGFYIRLNTFLNEYNVGNKSVAALNFDQLPELKYLDFWNFRAVEENARKLSLLKTFYEGYNSRKDTSIKMFPAFKLFFIEEDKGLTRNFNDFYTHNAIQSIEIVSNKNSASTTAIIRLSNVTNTLTNSLSFMREQSDVLGFAIERKDNNLFLGTLDVKPGTAIQIKMGYAPFDRLLKTIFQGRIIEMNVGPVCQLVCQSYGAQLNHEIVAEKFGIFSLVKEHGDVASAILDMIPGLEMLGKLPMFGLITQDFTGKNLRNIRGRFGDNYLMGNLLGNINNLIMAQDNPRDENIYLPFSFSSNINNKPSFDWVVFEQSVWEALQELTLYHRNVITAVKPFNDDPLSSKDELRETIVIGDKAGYFKFTDSFSLSNLNRSDVKIAAQQWSSLINNIPEEGKTAFLMTKDKETRQTQSERVSTSFLYGELYSQYVPIFKLMQDELSALVLCAILLQGTEGIPANVNIFDLVANRIANSKFDPDDVSLAVENIITVSKGYKVHHSLLESQVKRNTQVTSLNFSDSNEIQEVAISFANALRYLRKIINKNKTNLNFSPELYYQVKAQIQNTNDKLISNPQYKKIQQQHLLTDISDIISNNISLNSQFANMVNVYYTGEPKLSNANINKVNIEKDLNMWPVKAFGDTRDEYTRVYNSYQKNIDTNWFDTINSVTSLFKGFQRFKNPDKTNTKDVSVKQILGFDKTFELNTPNWNIFPSFVVVGVSLLKKQVEKMYQGTLEIVGNSDIQPNDIIHLQDYTNDMHGAFEVEEVIQTFTPERGFRTVITPNLITYDRDPIQMQDVQVINQIYDVSKAKVMIDVGLNLVASASSALLGFGTSGLTLGFGSVIFGGLALLPLYNGTVGAYKRHHKFLYDQLGNILGRDCINFTSLLYHGVPYMAGFEGVDYTNLKTVMNHNVAGIQSPIARYAAFKDPQLANILTNFNPEQYGLFNALTQGFFSSATGSNLGGN